MTTQKESDPPPNYAPGAHRMRTFFEARKAFVEGKVDEAIKTFDIAAKTDPNYEKTYLCLGDIYLVKRDLVKAIDNMGRINLSRKALLDDSDTEN